MRVVFEIHAQKLLKIGRRVFLDHLQEDKFVVPPVMLVQVVCEFLEVFTIDFLCMFSGREVDFCLDLEQGIRPIFIPSYRMAPSELRELKS